LMDDPRLDPIEHEHALRGLARINTLSLAGAPIASAIRLRFEAGSRLTLVDVAAGSGDVTLGVARRLKRQGIGVRVIGVDVSGRAVEACRDRFAGSGIEAEFRIGDALRDEPPPGDAVMSSLFLHHLTDDEIKRLLESMGRAARRVVAVCDLSRSRAGLIASRIVPRLLTRSSVVHVDAVRSCRAALTCAELSELATAAGLRGAVVRRAAPFRMLMTWDKVP